MDEIFDQQFIDEFAFLQEGVNVQDQLASARKADETKCKNALSKTNKCIISFSFRGYRRISEVNFSKFPVVSYNTSQAVPQLTVPSPPVNLKTKEISSSVTNAKLSDSKQSMEKDLVRPFVVGQKVISEIKISAKGSSSSSSSPVSTNLKELVKLDDYFREGLVISMEEFFGEDLVTIDLLNHNFLSGKSGNLLGRSLCLVKSLWSNQCALDKARCIQRSSSKIAPLDSDSYLIPLFTRFQYREKYYESFFMYRFIPLKSCFPYYYSLSTSSSSNNNVTNSSNSSSNNYDKGVPNDDGFEQKLSQLNNFLNICRYGPKQLVEAVIQSLGRLDIFANILRLRCNGGEAGYSNPLEAALEAGRDDSAKLLLSYGGTLSFIGTSGGRKNAVHSAVIGNSLEALRLLLAFIHRHHPIALSSHNANLTAFYQDMLEWRDVNDMTPLMLACKLLKRQSPDATTTDAKNNKNDIKNDYNNESYNNNNNNCDNDNKCQDHQRECINSDNKRRLELIKYLIERGAKVDAESTSPLQIQVSSHPLAIAVGQNSFEAVKYLLSIKKSRNEILRSINDNPEAVNANRFMLCIRPSAYVSSEWKLLKCNPCVKTPKELSIIMKAAKNGNLQILKLLRDLDVPYTNEVDLEGNNILQTVILKHVDSFHKSRPLFDSASLMKNRCCCDEDSSFRALVLLIVDWESDRWKMYKRALGRKFCCSSDSVGEEAARVFMEHNLFGTRNFHGQSALTMTAHMSYEASAEGKSIDSYRSKCSEVISQCYEVLKFSFFGSATLAYGVARVPTSNEMPRFMDLKGADLSQSSGGNAPGKNKFEPLCASDVDVSIGQERKPQANSSSFGEPPYGSTIMCYDSYSSLPNHGGSKADEGEGGGDGDENASPERICMSYDDESDAVEFDLALSASALKAGRRF